MLASEHPTHNRSLSTPQRVCRGFALLLLTALFLANLLPLCHAQDKDDPLTEAEVEKLRATGLDPPERIKLYMEFIGDRTDAIAEMVGDTRIQNKPPKIRQLLKEYTRLIDELQDNLDNYDETHADIRKSLKQLVPASKKWLDTVKQPPPDPAYDFPRKTATDASESLVDQATKLQTDLDKYFAEQKKQKKDEDKNGYTPQSPQ